MFGKKEADASNDRIMTIIASDVVVDGSIVAKKAIRVDGIVNGAVHTEKSVIVGHRAVVRGGIKASSVMTAGIVYGGIEAPKGKVEISDTGKVFGDVTASGIIIDEKAVFQGNCIMTGKKAQPKEETIVVPQDLDEKAEEARKAAEKAEEAYEEDASSEEEEEKPAVENTTAKWPAEEASVTVGSGAEESVAEGFVTEGSETEGSAAESSEEEESGTEESEVEESGNQGAEAEKSETQGSDTEENRAEKPHERRLGKSKKRH